MSACIYKIYKAAEWQEARSSAGFSGSRDDVRDGFIHFSTLGQLSSTLAKHYQAETTVIIACYLENGFSNSVLLWGKSRNEQIFPHVYGIVKQNSHTNFWRIDRTGDTNFDLSSLLEDGLHVS